MELFSEESNIALLKRVNSLKSHNLNELETMFRNRLVMEDVITAVRFSFDEVRSRYLDHMKEAGPNNEEILFPHWSSEALISQVEQSPQYRGLTLKELEERARSNPSETVLIGAVLHRNLDVFDRKCFEQRRYEEIVKNDSWRWDMAAAGF